MSRPHVHHSDAGEMRQWEDSGAERWTRTCMVGARGGEKARPAPPALHVHVVHTRTHVGVCSCTTRSSSSRGSGSHDTVPRICQEHRFKFHFTCSTCWECVRVLSTLQLSAGWPPAVTLCFGEQNAVFIACRNRVWCSAHLPSVPSPLVPGIACHPSTTAFRTPKETHTVLTVAFGGLVSAVLELGHAALCRGLPMFSVLVSGPANPAPLPAAHL